MGQFNHLKSSGFVDKFLAGKTSSWIWQVIFAIFVAGPFAAIFNSVMADGSSCNTAAIVAVNNADQDLYRWSRPSATEGDFSEATKVGWNWSEIRLIASDSADGNLFAIHNNGKLHLYNFGGSAYQSGEEIGHGWSEMRLLISAGNGVLYAVHSNGGLYWYRWLGSSWAKGSGTQIGHGWGQFSTVVSGGNGVLYGIDRDTGELKWYRHHSSQDPNSGFDSPKTIGHGWGGMRTVVGLGNGVLYAIDHSGRLMFYQHLATSSGDAVWSNNGRGAEIGHGWGNYERVTASSNSCSTDPRNGYENPANAQGATLENILNIENIRLVSSTQTCLDGVENKLIFTARKNNTYTLVDWYDNPPIIKDDMWGGSVLLKFTACKNSYTGNYDIAPSNYEINLTHRLDNLREITEFGEKSYEPIFTTRVYRAPSHDILIHPIQGHGLTFNSMKAYLDRAATKPGYLIDFNLMACGVAPMSSTEAASSIVKAVLGFPAPGPYALGVAQYFLSLVVPEPERSYRCFALDQKPTTSFHFDPKGKAIIDYSSLTPNVFHNYLAFENVYQERFLWNVEVEFHVSGFNEDDECRSENSGCSDR